MTDVMDQRDEAIYENKRIVNHATSAIVELTGEIIERGKMLNSMLASIQTESELFETAMARLGEASLERNALIRLIEANKDVREALESLGTLESERLSADELNTFLFLDYELNKLLIEMDENFDGDIDTKAINSIVNHASDLYQLVYNFIYHRPSDYPGPDDKAAANE